MSVFSIYVGADQDRYSRFNSYLEGVLYHALNFQEAHLILTREYKDTPLMMLFEKVDPLTDREGVALIRRDFPSAYIIVISETLDKEEISFYLRCGVNDTAVGDISRTRLINGAEFVERNQEMILSASIKREPLGKYKCPLWKRLFDIAGSLFLL
ncbi:MAG: hypothetical protein M0P27_09135, partial [Bacteroidales bacterium]|nr:hypothetical protein [Bacteroidales bacterium]